MSDLKEQLGLDKDKPIPADYNIPYFVHESDMCRLDMSHRRVERYITLLTILLFVALVASNLFWYLRF